VADLLDLKKMTNQSAVLTELKHIKLENRPRPKPGPTQVVIQMKSVGICGSDVHYYAHGSCGIFKVNGPIVLGHECSGVVAEIGSKVQNLKPGDRVALEPGIPCRYCIQCRTGNYNLCPDVQFLATPPYDGSLAQFILHESDFCYKLPDHVSFEEGALLEPLSVGVYACERGQILAGQSVLVQGAGPIGLVSLLAAKACGATRVIVADIKADRLEVAKRCGADAVVLSNEPQFTEAVRRANNNALVDAAIDCSGAESAIRSAVYCIRNGGRLMLVGRGSSPSVNFPLFEAADREIDVIGVFRYKNIYPKSLELVASGKIDVKPLVTHRFGLEQVTEAFETALHGKGGAIKVAVNIQS